MRILVDFQGSILPCIPQINTLLPDINQDVHKAHAHTLVELPEQGKLFNFAIFLSLCLGPLILELPLHVIMNHQWYMQLVFELAHKLSSC